MSGVLFRVDVGPGVGLGHIHRNLGLAEALRQLDIQSSFLLTNSEHGSSRVARCGFSVEHLGETKTGTIEDAKRVVTSASRFENPYLKACIQEYSRENVSSATQQRLEEVVCSSVAGLGDSARRLALAGGIFANVKLNQRLLALPNVDEVFVFPNMGDGGLSVGAAWLAHVQETGRRPDSLSTIYLGSEESDAEISSVLSESGLSYVHVSNICDQVADLLAKGHVVARFEGRMEFGPRALGNRSILYHPVDPSVNEWLNQRLSRSEFMPFAPATLEESAESCFDGFTGGRQAAYFMTMTFDCTRQMKDEAPATVHVDGTARPQIVSPVLHKQLYDIVDGYRRRTGRSSVINTSFNLHEEPIVCTIRDALRALKASRLPYLAAGNFLVETNEEILQ